MVYLTRRTTFSAAHRLWSNYLTQEENIALYDKCANPNGHGHNYVLEVTVRGTPDPHTGMVLNLTQLKQAINEYVIAWVDHRSEERRVGKECRSRRGPYTYNKNI